ncbi:hypothetical protein LCGC14_0711410 [marine sediment metagenome]|uniref:Uncharacterized protein n=2 Tax=root TaxID=1 RepID=A0A831VPA6_9FLAO|nr:hypothetical protein [Pricia sp.]HEA22650.1 hypothetical protein [Pricia antarctica]
MTTFKMLISVPFFIVFLSMPFFLSAQEVSVIDYKGTKTLVRNNSVVKADVPPIDPVMNDLWFDTSNSEGKRLIVWDGTSWVALTSTGIPGSIVFIGPDSIPKQDNETLIWDNINKRLGLGTNVPTETLDVEGQVRIRTMADAEDSDAFVMASADGVLRTSKINYGGRWTNTDIFTNINIDNTIVPLFGANDYVDDGTELYEVSGNALTVKQAGRYDLRANIALIGIADGNIFYDYDHDTNVNARIAINGIPVGAIAASGHIAFYNGHNNSSIHINEILELDANDTITILSYREANLATVRLTSIGSSSFIINKLH